MSDRQDPTKQVPHPGPGEQPAASRMPGEDPAGRDAGVGGTLKREGSAMLEDARDRAEGLAQEGARAGAEQARGFARAVHRAADELGAESPTLARGLHEAAGAVDQMARRMRGQSPAEMMRGAEDFARRQPFVFFGAAALAGFALARFARSAPPRDDRSATRREEADDGMRRGSGDMRPVPAEATPATLRAAGPDTPHELGAGGATPGGAARPGTLASASLGGAAAREQPADPDRTS